jgi:hypothetical protein
VEDLRKNLDGKKFGNYSLDVRTDVKFPGGRLPRFLHERFPDRLICPAIEFKKIFMNEWSGKLNPVALCEIRRVFMQEVRPWIRVAWQLFQVYKPVLVFAEAHPLPKIDDGKPLSKQSPCYAHACRLLQSAWKLLLVMGLQYLAQISLEQIHYNAGKSNALQKRDCWHTT